MNDLCDTAKENMNGPLLFNNTELTAVFFHSLPECYIIYIVPVKLSYAGLQREGKGQESSHKMKDISPLHSGTKYHGCPNIYDI